MAPDIRRHSARFWFPLVASVVGALAAAAWQWHVPLHELLGGLHRGDAVAIRPATPAADAAASSEAHAHEHEGHADESSIELSEQARRSLGLREGDVALTTFTRTIAVPGIVVDRKGRSKFTIIAPLTGSLTAVQVTEGQAVAPCQLLFELRLTHEELVQAQADLLKTTEEVDVVTSEINRLQAIAPEGLIPTKTILERTYELRKLEAVRTAQRQALLLHGITGPQVDSILRTRTLLSSMAVRAPESPAGPAAAPLVVQELLVERGQHVTAGDTLAVLVDHETLAVEGSAFEQDIPAVSRAARDGRTVSAVAEADALGDPRIDDLRIFSVANRVDPESRTLHFSVLLTNTIVRDATDEGRRFVEWRYKPGQRMQLLVPVEEWPDRFVLPVEAVAQEGLEHYVFRANGDHFDRERVHVEYRDAHVVVIANDGALFPGDRIALSSAQLFQVAIRNKAGGGVDPHAGHTH